MTSRQRDLARKYGPWVGLVIGLLTIASMTKGAADARYVTSRVYQLDRSTDSVTLRYELREMRDSLRSIGAGQTAILDELRAIRGRR